MRVFYLCGFLLLASCGLDAPASDLLPPAVWQFSPRGEAVECSTSVEVIFSEPIHPMAQSERLMALVSADDYDQKLLDAFDSPPLSASMQARCVPGRLDFGMGGSALRLRPDEPLLPQTHYAIMVSAAVRDLEGNRLVSEIRIDADGRQVGEPSHAVHWFKTR